MPIKGVIPSFDGLITTFTFRHYTKPMTQQIEKQALGDHQELKEKLLAVIAQNPAGLSKNEMLIKSGISQDLINLIIRQILEEYPVHLKVSEDYLEVVYVFDLANKKTGRNATFLDMFKAVWEKTSRALIFVGAIILAISWVFLSIPVAFSILGLALAIGFFNIFFNQGFQIGVQEFLIYWLGRKEEKDKLYEEKVILSYIAQKNYKITLAELMQVMDWTYDTAEQEAVWLLVNYGGEPNVDESAIIIFDFSHLKEETTASQAISKEYQTHQENKKQQRLSYTAEPEKKEKNLFSFKRLERTMYIREKIYTMNYFMGTVLIVGGLIMLVFYARFNQAGGDIRGIIVNPEDYNTLTPQDIEMFHWFIIISMASYFLTALLGTVVLIRWFAVQVPAQKEKLAATYKSILYDYIFQSLPQKTLFQTKSLSNNLSKFRKQVKKDNQSIKTEEIVEAVLKGFKAEPIAQDSGQVAYSFEHIGQELQVINNRR